MGFSSMDEMIQKITVNAQSTRVDWNKNFLPTSAAVAGEWHCLARGAGNPSSDTIYNAGTNLAFQEVNDSIAGSGGVRHGGNVSPATKHIVNASAGTSSATTAPCVLMLVDLLGFIRVTSVTLNTAQTINNTVGLSRYTDGAGVMAFAWNNNATALGAATPTLTLNYTNQAGVAGKTTPAVLPTCKTAAANGLIMYSGTGAGRYNPFIPLAAGDTGIRSIQSITLSASYVSGEFSIALCKPLITMPIGALGVVTGGGYVNGLPSLPRVYDGANLIWLMGSGAATPINSGLYGHIDFAWN